MEEVGSFDHSATGKTIKQFSRWRES